MKDKIKCLIRQALYALHHRRHERFYKKVMEMNGIPNTPAEGEKEWRRRWSQLGVKAAPTQYRVFSKYIGHDMNIVPEDICHDFIEPLLNPFRFAGYYADKNVFDKLFPEGYFPKTVIRRMNGFWYDNKYRRLALTDKRLQAIFSASGCNRMIVKPSVDGISGRGVQLFEMNDTKSRISKFSDGLGGGDF